MQTRHRETDLGRTLFELREALGWSQMRLNQESGVSRVTISKLETGQIEAPKMETLRRLAKALDVPVEDLLNPKVVRPSLEAPEEDEGRPADSTASRLDRVTEEVLEPLIQQRHAVVERWDATGVDALQEARCGAFEMDKANDQIYRDLRVLGADRIIENPGAASPDELTAARRQNNAFARLIGVAAEASNVARKLSRMAGAEAEEGFREFEELLAAAEQPMRANRQ